jgi:hypothetical protein
MEDRNVRNSDNRKKAYSRPRLRTIELVPEQTLGVGCKDYEGLGAPGPTNALCGTMAAPCYQDGS